MRKFANKLQKQVVRNILLLIIQETDDFEFYTGQEETEFPDTIVIKFNLFDEEFELRVEAEGTIVEMYSNIGDVWDSFQEFERSWKNFISKNK